MKTQLTPAELERLPLVRDKWLKIGLATGPGNREKAWQGACEAYRVAGLRPPRFHVWMDSPLRAVLACSVSDQVLDQVRAQVSDQVRAQVRAQVSDQVLDQVRAQVSDQVRAQVRDQVRDQVRAQVSDQVRDFAQRIWWNPGQFDAHWMSFYDALCDFCAFTTLSGLMAVAENSAIAWMFPDIVVFCDRPTVIARDEQNRIHSASGPAVGFRDGWGVWAIHGVRVPRYVVENPSEITIEKIESENNAEVRRVMIERYGQDHYLLDSGAEKIHEDDFGTLYRKEISGDEPLVMVKVINSTPEPDGSFKDYFLRVPPTMQRAREAVAWTFGLAEHDYEPAIET